MITSDTHVVGVADVPVTKIQIKCTELSGIELQVTKDIAMRQQWGLAKYKTTVADNPLSRKQWLQHAYEEALDLAVYLKKVITDETNAVPRD